MMNWQTRLKEMTVAIDESLVQAMPVSAPVSKRRFYAPELDALRFGAFMLVFLRHISTSYGLARQSRMVAAGPVAATAGVSHASSSSLPPMLGIAQGVFQSFDFGVCLFFFLSSFLITRLLLIERDSTGKIAVRDFYIRRSLRIWPLYFAFLAFIAVSSRFVPILGVSSSRLIASAFFVSNWAAVLYGWASMAIQPLWSVSVEEQFYLVWPLCAQAGRKAIIAISAICIIVSLGTLVYFGCHKGTIVSQIWPNTLTQSLFFAGGALTALFSFPERRRLGITARLGLACAGFSCWLLASMVFHVVRTISPGPISLVAGYLFVLLGTFLLFSSVAGWSGTRVPNWLIQLGRMSYGLYVFHISALLVTEHSGVALMGHLNRPNVSLSITQGINAAFALLLTVVCAVISYNMLELPFLQLKKRFTLIPSRPE